MKNLQFKFFHFAQLTYAVITGLAWMLVPVRIRARFERSFQRKGIRTIVHQPYMGEYDQNPNKPFIYKLMFGSGAGYIGGATLYLAFGGCRPRDRHQGWAPPVQHFVFGLTNNANAVPLAGRW